MAAADHIRFALDRRSRSAATASQAATTSTYAALIGRLAPGENPALVEAIMRREHGTLDNIEPVQFARAVKAAVARMDTHHAQNPDAAA